MDSAFGCQFPASMHERRIDGRCRLTGNTVQVPHECAVGDWEWEDRKEGRELVGYDSLRFSSRISLIELRESTSPMLDVSPRPSSLS